ncbi:helix-turn-helix domain-containing protein [Lysinibacillus xylanilyticus]|uniref:helix-turn-helix domain-containing protein n=1 Tax=Lysinibacillus xylanilyticus TaxID=582475 RepID=UPI003CFC5A7C
MYNNLGKEIEKKRKEKKMTQKELSNNICTQPTISMIERGEITPSLEILTKISKKLDLKLEYFTDFLIYKNPAYIRKFTQKIDNLTVNQNYNTALKLIETELNNNTLTDFEPIFKAYLMWVKVLCLYNMGKKDIHKTINEIKNILELIKNFPNSNFLSIRIYNSIALLYSINKDFNKALFYYNKIDFIQTLEDTSRLNNEVYILRILYNKIKTLYDMGNYNESIDCCNIGIQKSIELENMSSLGNFFYYLGQNYEKMQYPHEDISKCYHNSLFIFGILNRENYISAIKSNKKTFL